MPKIAIYNSADTHFRGMTIKQGKDFFTDEFTDELFMVIKQNNRINIITACSHRGIINICTTATEYFKLPVGLILGGFHMKDCTSEQYMYVTNYLQKLQPKSIGVCHCTGVEKFADLYRNCDTHVFYNFTGNEITIS